MRVEKHSLRKDGITNEWFNLPTDFINNNIPDTFGVNDAQFVKSNCCYSPSNPAQNIGNSNIPSSSSSFSCSILMTNLGGGSKEQILSSVGVGGSRFNGLTFGVDNGSFYGWSYKSNGTNLQSSISSANVPTWTTLTFNGGLFRFYQNGALQAEVAGGAYLGTWAFDNNVWGFLQANWHKLIFHSNKLSLSEVQDLHFNYNVKELGLAAWYNFEEGEGSEIVDRVNGHVLAMNTPFQRLSKDTIVFDNQEKGFEVYSLISDPTIKKLVPLSILGISLGLSFSGYVSDGVILQSGELFLNSGTTFKLKEPVSQAIIDKDTSNFFQIAGVPKEISYANLLTAPSYVNYVLGVNLITNVTI